MIAEKMKPFVQNNSAIRMMFEEGNRLRAKYGANKVYDFSLGNPSVPAPDCVREAIIDLVNNEEPTVLHGYMSNAGFEDVRETIAQSLNRRFGTAFSAHNLIMTVGAASGLNVILKTILNPGEEVIVLHRTFWNTVHMYVTMTVSLWKSLLIQRLSAKSERTGREDYSQYPCSDRKYAT